MSPGEEIPRLADQRLSDQLQHLCAFGFGIHRCLGNRLAEIQLRVLCEEILTQSLSIELDGEPERISSGMFHGLSRVPVRIRN